MSGSHLSGLDGTNPLGFLAALGVQVAFANEDEQPRLWWSDEVTPRAVVDEGFSVDRISAQALQAFSNWISSPAMNPAMPKGDELKLQPKDIRTYLQLAVGFGWSGGLATALLAEGSLDNQGIAKPSDLYFAAGPQKFLDMARAVMKAAKIEEIATALEGPWAYASDAPSLGWDVSDDRVYALQAAKPGVEKKSTNPGAEALALLGLSRYPGVCRPRANGNPGVLGKVESRPALMADLANAGDAACREIAPGPCLRPSGGIEPQPLVPRMGNLRRLAFANPPIQRGRLWHIRPA